MRLPEVHGRADTLFGRVVFEFKRDLRQELRGVFSRLPDYLAERERQTGCRFLGIATDGATFLACKLRDGALVEIGRHEPHPARAEALLAWIEPGAGESGRPAARSADGRARARRNSLSFGRARGVLERLWAELQTHTEVVLKRQLWDGLLREAYGTPVGDDALFLQHTYLTIVAKTIAARVLDLAADDAGAILSGRALDEVGIQGAVESDFFDWILELADGRDLVRQRVSQRAGRDPEQQADVLLGNPPWIAYRHLSAEMKTRLREACRRLNLWVGGVLASQQDISALLGAQWRALSATRWNDRLRAALRGAQSAGFRRAARGDFRNVQVQIRSGSRRRFR